MFSFIYSWIDVIWLPVMYFAVHKQHRWWSLGFVLSSMILIRLLAEMMIHGGYDNGVLGFLDSHVHIRGIVVSSFFYVLFMILAHYSQETRGAIFLAACLSIFFMIFVSVSIVMLL